jgi:hypothetical protein
MNTGAPRFESHLERIHHAEIEGEAKSKATKPTQPLAKCV